MSKKYVIGLDLGTTSAKAVLFTYDGHVVTDVEETYPLHHPHPSWAEQNPDQIVQAAEKVLGHIVTRYPADDILAVGLSSAMHSLICVDQDGKALSPSIIWADGRSQAQTEEIKTHAKDIYIQTGTPIHPMSPLTKLKWMKDNHYEPYMKAHKFLSIKEYLLWQWFGRTDVDYAIASATGLFDVHRLTWSSEALNIAGISEEQLSRPVSPTHTYQGLQSDVARKIGLPLDLPIVIGSSDGPLANLGNGAITDGDVAMTVGTSGAIRRFASQPHVDALQETFCYAFTEDKWILGGPTNNGGIVLRWLKELLGEQEVQLAEEKGLSPYDLLTKLAADVPAGAENLLFLPYLNGERAPIWDAQAKGSFIGLTLRHQKAHMVRAGLEGVIFSLYHVAQSLERLSGRSNHIYASGGFARSHLWLQILADVFEQEVKVPESHQSSAWGAAWLAMMALGEAPSLEAIKAFIPMRVSCSPNHEQHQTYKRLYPIYEQAVKALQPSFQALHQSEHEV
ncbi:gluconokinase [Caldalkalibacillus salinus]|uniref:gluconokinase n=1 Tax=Caldalkalibacillus salinus TaxID=2803787 RepID=UPI001921E7F6|nr:gluconokinase [Caldalkalibacillus salinus]